jgi:tetratricopeptide (TPR) repeat protein
MKEFFIKLRKRQAARLLALAIVLLASAVLLGPRLVEAAKWNSWTIQYMWHALGSSRSQGLPASPPAGNMQAKIWLAQEALDRGAPQEALDLLNSIIFQNDIYAQHVQAAALEEQGNFRGAIQLLARVKDYNFLLDLARKATNANDQADALAAYNAAWAINPEKGVMPLVDYLTFKKGDLFEAESLLKGALSAYPTSDQRLYWYRTLGDNLRRQKLFDEAEAIYQSALTENPNDWEIHIGLGWVYYERGDGSQPAILEFQKAIAIDATRGDGYYAAAQMLRRAQQFTEADSWYRLALERDPQQNSWYISWANNARSAGDLTQALSIYWETARLFPDYPASYYEMAWAYYLKGEHEEAKDNIKKALSLMNPPDAWYYVRAGQILELCGDNDQALEAYRNALTVDPTNTTAQSGIARLGKP